MTVGEIKRAIGNSFAYDSSTDTYYIMDYHPYWHGNNPDFGGEDSLLLDFKKGYESAIKHFYNKLSYRLNKISEAGDVSANIWLCPVPSHDPSKTNCNVYDMISRYRKIKAAKILKRTHLVDKLSFGGNRDVSVHLDSIGSDPSIKLGSNAIIILVDDVLTSGNSIKACKEILLRRNDVSSVISIVIAKTKNSRSYKKPETGFSDVTDSELDSIWETVNDAPFTNLHTPENKKYSNASPKGSAPKAEATQNKGESMSEHPPSNVVIKTSTEIMNKHVEKKTRKSDQYEGRVENFRYGFFHPWVLLIMSIIFLIIVALTINRRLYYQPLVYMFVFTPMAFLWAAPCSGIMTSILAFIFKGLASILGHFKEYRASYYLSRLNRALIMIISILIWVTLISMTIWSISGIERSCDGPWEYCIINFGHSNAEQEIYSEEIKWVLDAHRCPRCKSRSIYPVSEYERGYVPRYVFDACENFFGGCCNVNVNPVHECRNCGLVFRFSKERGLYIPVPER